MTPEEIFDVLASPQHDDHVTTWLLWRTAVYGSTFVRVKIDGTRTYLNPEDVYIRD